MGLTIGCQSSAPRAMAVMGEYAALKCGAN
jgi:hypothetical protein